MKRHHVNRIFVLSIIVGVLLVVGFWIYQTQAQEERPRQRVVEVEIGGDDDAEREGAFSTKATIVPGDVIIKGRLGVKAGTGDFQMAVLDSGIGIGTTNPQAKLHIAGTPGVDGIMFPDNTVQTTAAAGGGIPLFFAGGLQSSIPTVYSSFLGNCCNPETSFQLPFPRSGTLANLFVLSNNFPPQPPPAGSIVTVTVRVNGTDTPLTVTYTTADSTNIVSNTVDTVSVSQGDLIVVEFSETGSVAPNLSYQYKGSLEFK